MNPFWPNVPVLYPLKNLQSRTYGSLRISEGRKLKHWLKIGTVGRLVHLKANKKLLSKRIKKNLFNNLLTPHTHTQTHTQTHTDTHRHTHTHTQTQREADTHRHTEQTGTHRHTQTYRTDRHTQTHTDTHTLPWLSPIPQFIHYSDKRHPFQFIRNLQICRFNLKCQPPLIDNPLNNWELERRFDKKFYYIISQSSDIEHFANQIFHHLVYFASISNWCFCLLRINAIIYLISKFLFFTIFSGSLWFLAWNYRIV